jgi:hypothetical protein
VTLSWTTAGSRALIAFIYLFSCSARASKRLKSSGRQAQARRVKVRRAIVVHTSLPVTSRHAFCFFWLILYLYHGLLQLENRFSLGAEVIL